MRSTLSSSILGASLLLAATFSHGQSVSSDPVGFVSVTVKANSDATIALPLNRSAIYKGVIQSITGNTLTVAGTSPGWTPDQLVQSLPSRVSTYAVQVASGTKEGMVGKVTANSANSVTIQLDAGDDLSGIQTEAVNGAGLGDHIDIMPFWTPSSMFSAAPAAGVLMQSFVAAGAGVNLGASELYAHAGGNVWEDGISGDDATHTALRFGMSIIVRNPAATDLTVYLAGSVPMSTSRIRIATLANNKAQDLFFGYMSPVPESLSSIGNPAVPLAQRSANALGFPVQTGDSIIGFDNSSSGINKGASEIYTWNGAAWEDDINGGEINFTVKLNPGVGYVFRKAPTTTATSLVWSHVPAYLQ